MSLFIVTYDVAQERESNREQLQHEIARLGGKTLSESCYAIESTATARQIFDRLLVFIKGDDRLFVSSAGYDRCGTHYVTGFTLGPGGLMDTLKQL